MARTASDPAGYCTPVVIQPKSGKQVVIWTPENVHGVEATTGKPLWKVPYKVTYGVLDLTRRRCSTTASCS